MRLDITAAVDDEDAQRDLPGARTRSRAARPPSASPTVADAGARDGDAARPAAPSRAGCRRAPMVDVLLRRRRCAVKAQLACPSRATAPDPIDTRALLETIRGLVADIRRLAQPRRGGQQQHRRSAAGGSTLRRPRPPRCRHRGRPGTRELELSASARSKTCRRRPSQPASSSSRRFTGIWRTIEAARLRPSRSMACAASPSITSLHRQRAARPVQLPCRSQAGPPDGIRPTPASASTKAIPVPPCPSRRAPTPATASSTTRLAHPAPRQRWRPAPPQRRPPSRRPRCPHRPSARGATTAQAGGRAGCRIEHAARLGREGRPADQPGRRAGHHPGDADRRTASRSTRPPVRRTPVQLASVRRSTWPTWSATRATCRMR